MASSSDLRVTVSAQMTARSLAVLGLAADCGSTHRRTIELGRHGVIIIIVIIMMEEFILHGEHRCITRDHGTPTVAIGRI